MNKINWFRVFGLSTCIILLTCGIFNIINSQWFESSILFGGLIIVILLFFTETIKDIIEVFNEGKE